MQLNNPRVGSIKTEDLVDSTLVRKSADFLRQILSTSLVNRIYGGTVEQSLFID
jgi:hypothetical protein